MDDLLYYSRMASNLQAQTPSAIKARRSSEFSDLRWRRIWLVAGFWWSLSSNGCATTLDLIPHPGLSPIESPSALYTLRPLLTGWSIYPAEHPSLRGSDMALMHEESGVRVLINVENGAATSVDNYVDRRRNVIKQSYHIVSVEEERRFQAHSHFTPVSVSLFRVAEDAGQPWFPVVSAVIRGRTAIAEIFAIGGTYPQNMAMVEDLIAGLRFTAPDGGQR